MSAVMEFFVCPRCGSVGLTTSEHRSQWGGMYDATFVCETCFMVGYAERKLEDDEKLPASMGDGFVIQMT